MWSEQHGNNYKGQFTSIWTAAHHRICRSTASRSPLSSTCEHAAASAFRQPSSIGPYIGWSDVTVSMATIRSPFCGHNMTQCVESRGEDLSCYLNKIQSASVYENVRLTCQQGVFKRDHSSKHFWEFYPQHCGEKSAGIDMNQNYVTVTLWILAVPRFRLPISHFLTAVGRSQLLARWAMAWNSLPDFNRDLSSSTDCFRRLLKTYLFARYYQGFLTIMRYPRTYSLTQSLRLMCLKTQYCCKISIQYFYPCLVHWQKMWQHQTLTYETHNPNRM